MEGILAELYFIVAEDVGKKCPTQELKKRFPFHINMEMILRLDIEGMDYPFQPETDIYYAKYSSSEEIYPDLTRHNNKLIEYRRR